MKKVTAREYARRHKMSLFQVIKKIQKGELRGEQIEENGLKVQYVLLEEEKESEKRPTEGASASVKTETAENDPVLEEVKKLRRELSELRKLVEECCRKE